MFVYLLLPIVLCLHMFTIVQYFLFGVVLLSPKCILQGPPADSPSCEYNFFDLFLTSFNHKDVGDPPVANVYIRLPEGKYDDMGNHSQIFLHIKLLT